MAEFRYLSGIIRENDIPFLQQHMRGANFAMDAYSKTAAIIDGRSEPSQL